MSVRSAGRVAAAVLCAVLAVAACGGRGEESADQPTAAPSPTSTTDAPTDAPTAAPPADAPTASPTGSPDDADGQVAPPPAQPDGEPTVGTVRLSAVEVGETGDFGAGVEAVVRSVRDLTVEATSPGEISGPGVAVSLRVTNSGVEVTDLDGIAVTAVAGDAPTSPISSAPAEPLTGGLVPGSAADGVYVFRLPDGESGPLSVEVEYNRSANIVVIDP